MTHLRKRMWEELQRRNYSEGRPAPLPDSSWTSSTSASVAPMYRSRRIKVPWLAMRSVSEATVTAG